MDVQCSFAVPMPPAPKTRAHGKPPPIKAANFAQIPSWASLKSSPSMRTPQTDRTKVESLHLDSLSEQGNLEEALEFLKQIEKAGVSVRPYSYRTLFQACAKSKSLLLGRFIHEQMQRIVKNPSGFVEYSVLKMYCECASLEDAHRVFDGMSERSAVSWGTLISAYAQERFLAKAVYLFSKGITYAIKPNSLIYTGLLRSLSNPSLLEIGKQLHSHAIRSGFGNNISVYTAASNMYMKCGCLEGAQLVFSKMTVKDVATWTTLIVCYTRAGRQKDALVLFVDMVNEGVKLDEYVFSSILKASAALEDFIFGRQIHGHVVKLGLQSGFSVGTPLVDFYVKCSKYDSAFKAFDTISDPNDFSWSALINAYCQIGKFEESLQIFQSLKNECVDINPYTYTSIFQACSALVDMSSGVQAHADAIKRNLVAHQHGYSALITMYSKCGRLDYARQAFKSIDGPDTVAWTAIIAGYAYEGNVTEALGLFKWMQESGVRPNGVTLVAILTACSHSGLVSEGKQYLDCMCNNYGITPTIDHYDCMIDIYSRAGYLQEALELIRTMPFVPDAMSWKCLLSGCWTYKNLEIGKIAAENLFQLDREDTAGYVLMFNLYVSAAKWEEAAAIRKLMAERNLRKELSCSWITVKGKVHRFIVGDRHHPRTEEIYSKLKEFNSLVEDQNDNDLLVEDDVLSSLPERKEQLLEHSERLAIAFGLISIANNAPIVVFKNLRACRDCHEFVKHVSILTGREIVVRDSSRFHHFKLGECSCSDYW